jgi:5-methylcytosine-specific restriction endonuclease McrA
LTLLIEKVEKAKLGAAKRPRPQASIRPGTDTQGTRPPAGTRPSRHMPNAVKRVTWQRDEGRCAFVSADGQRCGEAAYLEFHHVVAYAKRGPSTVDNISLRCRRHNQYEAELEFGPREREGRAP